MGNLAVSFRKAYSGVKTIFGRGKATAKTAETIAAKPVNQTVVKPSLPGTTRLERQMGDNLFVSETSTLADGSTKTTMLVYGENGKFIGKGGDQGLAMFRETTRTRQAKGSILGGDRVTINKQYNDTMAMSAYDKNIVKEYTPQGILEHAETTIKYRHNGIPKTTTYDRTKSLSGETAYSQTLKEKKAAEQAAIAEKEAAAAAKKAQEAEAAAKFAASRPRFNVGKVLGMNIEELRILEKAQPNGAVKRYYFKPGMGEGHGKPVMVTYDHGILHKEWIRNGKEDLIYLKQIGKEKPYIVAKNGNVTQVSYVERTPEYVTSANGREVYLGRPINIDKQYYNDGIHFAEFPLDGVVVRGKVSGPDVLKDIKAEIGAKRLDFGDLLKPYAG